MLTAGGCARDHLLPGLAPSPPWTETPLYEGPAMNGVRRFLNGGGPAAQDASGTPPSQSPPRTQPLTIPNAGPSWPPQSPMTMAPSSPAEPTRTTTAALFLRKDKQKPVPVPSTDEGHASSPVNGRTSTPISSSLTLCLSLRSCR
jgi:hypothetical protein